MYLESGFLFARKQVLWFDDDNFDDDENGKNHPNHLSSANEDVVDYSCGEHKAESDNSVNQMHSMT